MGIKVEFNPDLALRKSGTTGRSNEECIPEKIEVAKTYDFLKEGQRNYWLEVEIPLLETEGNQKLSRPIASIIILESTHFIKGNKIYTKGRYMIKEIFNIADEKIHFGGMNKK